MAISGSWGERRKSSPSTGLEKKEGCRGPKEGEVTSLGTGRLDSETWLSPELLGDSGKDRALRSWTSMLPSSPPPSLCPDLLHRLLHEPSPLLRPCSGYESLQLCSLGECQPYPGSPAMRAWKPSQEPLDYLDAMGPELGGGPGRCGWRSKGILKGMGHSQNKDEGS